jgi:ferredoxin-type protein NapG
MSSLATRRRFITQAAQGTAAAATGGLLWYALIAQQAHATVTPLRPPGARQERDFAATCIKCGLCVDACPYDTLKLARTAEPVVWGTPTFVPRDVPCYMCTDVPCARACPTGALDSGFKDIAAARRGLAVIDPESCLSWHGLRCEICFRVCPVKGKAITVANHPRRISKHALFVPVVHSDACTGCGVCEKKCPTEVAAIRVVDPKLVQGRIGVHYRLQDRPDAAPAQARSADEPRAAPERKPSPAGALDYLNRGGTP